MKQNGLKIKVLLLFILLNSINIIEAQNYKLCNNKWIADSLFRQKEFLSAKLYYQKVISQSKVKQRVDMYYLSSCYAKLNQIDSSVFYINKAIAKGLRYIKFSHIEQDANLVELKKTEHWSSIKSKIIENIKAYNERKPLKPKIKKELIKRRKLDQLFRKIMSSSKDSTLLDSILRLQNNIDKDNQRYLSNIIEKYGWTDKVLVGDTASHVAWLIAQHADNNVDFQETCLLHIEESVLLGQAKKSEVAYLKDRILINKGLPQIYGTQFRDNVINNKHKIIPKPIKDIKNVDKFRYFVGLQPLQKYIEYAEKRYIKKNRE